MSKTKKLTISAIVIALYIVVTMITASFSFGAVQIRMANSLYGLSFIYKFLPLPLGLAVILSNLLFGGLGFVDVIGGFLVTTLVCFVISKLPKQWMIVPTIILGIGLLIPTYLHLLLHIPYIALAVSIVLGQIIPAVLSYILVKVLKNVLTR